MDKKLQFVHRQRQGLTDEEQRAIEAENEASTKAPFPTPMMDLQSILNPIRKSCNKPYTLKQIHYFQYFREDLGLRWDEIVGGFVEEFKDPERESTVSGLQCRYYRAQKYPLLCLDAKMVLDDAGRLIMHNISVRQRDTTGGLVVPIFDEGQRLMKDKNGTIFMRELTEKERVGASGRKLELTLKQYIKLVDRVPELVKEYWWVKKEDKEKAKEKAQYRLEHDIVLPGAELTGGKAAKTIVLVSAAGLCKLCEAEECDGTCDGSTPLSAAAFQFCAQQLILGKIGS